MTTSLGMKDMARGTTVLDVLACDANAAVASVRSANHPVDNANEPPALLM